MISLLPPIAKKELAAARSNVLLLRYLFLTAGLIGFLCVEMTVLYLFFGQQRTASEQAIQNNQRDTAQLASIKNEATAFNNDLKVADAILSKQISYTSIIKEFADTMPAGTVITQLSINPTTLGKPSSIMIKAKNQGAVLAFKDSFAASPYFEKVNIQNISNPAPAPDSAPAAPDSYPFSATIDMTFKSTLLTLGGTP